MIKIIKDRIDLYKIKKDIKIAVLEFVDRIEKNSLNNDARFKMAQSKFGSDLKILFLSKIHFSVARELSSDRIKPKTSSLRALA